MPTDTPTTPPHSEAYKPDLSEQKRLTAILANSEDPIARLVAHISSRQLEVAEQLVSLSSDVKRLGERLSGGFEELCADLDAVRSDLGLVARKRTASLRVVEGSDRNA